jgi:hypothetical protein
LPFKYKKKREYTQLFQLGLNKKKEMKKKMKKKSKRCSVFPTRIKQNKGKQEDAQFYRLELSKKKKIKKI